jgi:hypothetical protein
MNKLANRKNERKKVDLIKVTGKKGGKEGFTV